MHKILLLLLACTIALSGCANTAQIEALAFAEILGVDLNDQGSIEVCIEIPKISGQRGESSSGGSKGASNLVYSASGSSFDEALNLLQWVVPRRLDLSQIKLIVVSESLARSDKFHRTAGTIMATPRLYTAARLAVCSGSAKDFVSAQKPVIGTRLSSELTSTFEDYIRNGYIPDETFADMYYKSKSVYSDALAIYAESAASEQAQAVSAIVPDSPQQADAEMQQSNRFLGAAVFRKGIMVGRLTGEEYLYCKMLRGESQTFPFSLENQTVGLATMGKPEVSVDIKAEPMKISIGLSFSIVSSSRTAPVEKLRSALHDAFMNAIRVCTIMGAEPFDLSAHASGSFLTIDQWEQFGWQERFMNSDIAIDIRILSPSE